jgi:hypothetical protein
MPGLSGDRSALVADEREVDPRLLRTVFCSLGFSAVCAACAMLVFALLSWAGSPVPGYLADHPAVVWLLSAGLFTALWAHLGVLECGRRDARVRAAAWRAARTSRSGASGATAGAHGSCRNCRALRAQNAVLRAQIDAGRREVLVLGEQTTRETT